MDKLTDKEIIGTLDLIAKEQNSNFLKTVLDLINRLKTESLKYRYKAQIQKGELARLNKLVTEQKAEIERLQQNLKEAHIDIQDHKARIEIIKASLGKSIVVLHNVDLTKKENVEALKGAYVHIYNDKECLYELKKAKRDGVRLLGIHLLDKSKNGRIKSSEIVDGVYEVLDELS